MLNISTHLYGRRVVGWVKEDATLDGLLLSKLGQYAVNDSRVFQAWALLGFDRFSRFHQHRTSVCCALLSGCVYRVLIGACNPMLCPFHVFFFFHFWHIHLFFFPHTTLPILKFTALGLFPPCSFNFNDDAADPKPYLNQYHPGAVSYPTPMVRPLHYGALLNTNVKLGGATTAAQQQPMK